MTATLPATPGHGTSGTYVSGFYNTGMNVSGTGSSGAYNTGDDQSGFFN
jgi:hypothetical protein